MDRQIVDPDPGKNYNAAISASEQHFEMEKKTKCTSQSSKP